MLENRMIAEHTQKNVQYEDGQNEGEIFTQKCYVPGKAWKHTYICQNIIPLYTYTRIVFEHIHIQVECVRVSYIHKYLRGNRKIDGRQDNVLSNRTNTHA